MKVAKDHAHYDNPDRFPTNRWNERLRHPKVVMPFWDRNIEEFCIPEFADACPIKTEKSGLSLADQIRDIQNISAEFHMPLIIWTESDEENMERSGIYSINVFMFNY